MGSPVFGMAESAKHAHVFILQAMAADKSDTWFAARNMKKVSA